MLNRQFSAGWIFLLVVMLPAIAVAEERINQFSSNITINPDSSLNVTETITVTAEGRQISRGIYRDFPTQYEDRLGNVIRAGFEIQSVRRNGMVENWVSENLRNGIRIRIGNADYFLDRGKHTYEISYRTTRQLGFFAEYDELYWNVTGNGWGFPIDAASATVHLPEGARIRQEMAYTGPQGARGTDFQIQGLDDARYYRSTRPLSPGEGLTIAVAWQKGLVAEPTAADQTRWFLRDNMANGIAMLGALLVFTYYFLAWRRFGRDPQSGAIFPRYTPPAGLSPAATRFIWQMSFDRKTFSAALIQMAVKGYLTLQEEDDSFRLVRQDSADLQSLSNGERKIAKQLLLKQDSFLLDNENHSLISQTISKLRDSLVTEYEKAHFQRNTLFFILGMFISFCLIVLTGTTGGDIGSILAGIGLTVVASVLFFMVLHFWGDDSDPTFKIMPFRALRTTRAGSIVLQLLIFIVFMGASGLSGVGMDLFASPVLPVSIALMGLLNVLFFFLLKRPTLAGRSLMDEIEGFRMYLSVAEEERLNLMNPPDKTPDLFEKYLPFAIALDVENEWADKFTAVLAAASQASAQGGYRPRWYRGRSWQPGESGLFTRNLGNSLGSAVASAARAPGSSSGSSGGGFSGGGGGGGGGGGW